MAGSAHATLDAASRERGRRGSAGSARAVWPPAAVAAGFTLAQLLLVRPGMGLGWDETVYVSQVSGHAPASFFSAPRARGVSLLVAPVAAWSSSTALLRVYLALLSGLALFLALRAWRGLFPVRVVALGGALFASLWVTLFYGPQAMPNYGVAVAALAAVACFLRAPTDRGALWGLAGSAVLMAWMRPVDAVWTALPLLVLGLARRHRRTLLVLLAGLAAGAAQWVIEAYTSYGGLARRLSDGSAIQGGLGWHFAVVDQLRSLGGRTLCRPCTVPLPNPLLTLWWFALPLLAALALVLAVRARRTTATALPLACAATAAFPYLFLIGYAAPRFLLPAYALLALPVADALVRLLTPSAPPHRRTAAQSQSQGQGQGQSSPPARFPIRRPVVTALVCAGLAGHLAVQLTVLVHTVDNTTAAHRAWARTAAELDRRGVRPPCLVTGHEAIPVAFAARCASAATTGPNANITVDGIVGAARRAPVAVLVRAGSAPPRYARDWASVRVGEVRFYYVVPGAGS
ncbi:MULTISPECIES: hypothetical protein [Streptomyces]|uniref:Integral membrane protein n=1 Tax=Streptomyces tricolor TaxID=68277 RepID=A0ABS9JG10_9ACTN|nr:hypothetical protein [Streptomyces tricolor]MCG0064492.1 hypothetical protein [Streptomyces tricolor]